MKRSFKTDIIQSISAELRAEALKRGAGLFRLERGTLMLRHPQTLNTIFFADEADTIGQLLHGLPLLTVAILRAALDGKVALADVPAVLKIVEVTAQSISVADHDQRLAVLERAVTERINHAE